MPKQLLRKEDNKGGGGRLRKRVKSGECRKEHNDNKDREVDEDEALESSGYSSGEKDEPNVIYFKVISIVIDFIEFLSSSATPLRSTTFSGIHSSGSGASWGTKDSMHFSSGRSFAKY